MFRLLEEHIKTEMKHYSGQVFAWDVVNEALDEKGDVKDSPWYNQPGIGLAEKGTAYVEQAFRWAREADAKALLFYNETGGEGLSRKSDAVYAMLKDFKRHGVPIDGVGLQMHISHLDYDTDAVAKNIERLTKLGLQVHITELDVSLPVDSQGDDANDEDLLRQAEIYRGVRAGLPRNSQLHRVSDLGFHRQFVDWLPLPRDTRGAALPFDRGYQPKPAYQALLGRTICAGSPGDSLPQLLNKSGAVFCIYNDRRGGRSKRSAALPNLRDTPLPRTRTQRVRYESKSSFCWPLPFSCFLQFSLPRRPSITPFCRLTRISRRSFSTRFRC